MNGFFARMGERAAGRPAALRVRPRVFEAQRSAPLARADAVSGPADPADPPGLDVQTVLDVARDLLPQPPGRTGAPRRPDQAVHLAAVGSLPTDTDAARTAQVPGPAEQHRPTPAPAEPSGPDERRTPSAATAAAAAAPPRRTGGASRRRPTSAAHDPTPVPPDELAGRRGAPAPQATPTFTDVTRPPVELPTVTAPDLGDLLRRHVLPELVARGLAGPHERVEVVTDTAAPGRNAAPSTARRARPGAAEAVALSATPPHYTTITASGESGPGRAATRRASTPHADPSPGALTAQPQVQVHIDRVVVARPAPPPRPAPPSPAPRSRPQPDHETYLARRREGR